MSQATTDLKAEMPTDSDNLDAVVARLAAVVLRRLPPGDLAALRRLDPTDPSAPALWRALLLADVKLPGDGAARDRLERRWAVILTALASLGDLHRPGAALGRALASAGFSELRLIRLLRAAGPALENEIATACRFLSAKAEPANTADLAKLLFSDTHDAWRESERRRIAREYYAKVHALTAKGD